MKGKDIIENADTAPFDLGGYLTCVIVSAGLVVLILKFFIDYHENMEIIKDKTSKLKAWLNERSN